MNPELLWVTIPDAAKIMGADRTTVYRLVRDGTLKARRDHGRLCVPLVPAVLYAAEAMRRGGRGRRLGQRYNRGKGTA